MGRYFADSERQYKEFRYRLENSRQPCEMEVHDVEMALTAICFVAKRIGDVPCDEKAMGILNKVWPLAPCYASEACKSPPSTREAARWRVSRAPRDKITDIEAMLELFDRH